MNTIVKTITLAFALAIVGIIAFGFAPLVHANPESFFRSSPVGATTGAASTSPNYMTAGNATTTISFDSGSGNTFALNTAIFNLGIKSSTTVNTLFGTTTLSFRIEESDNNIDWAVATSSTITTGTCEQVGSNCTASTSMAYRQIEITRPLRYMRAVVGVNPGSSNNAGVWGQWVGRKENQ
jgi:hypothetical protein